MASFRLQTSGSQYNDTVVGSLEVYDAHRDNILASVWLTAGDFRAPLVYQEFPVPFFCEQTHDLEFRVWWRGNTYVRVDRVEIRAPSVAFTEPWELQVFDHPRNFSAPSAADWQTIIQQQPIARTSLRNLALTKHGNTFNDFAPIATLTTELPKGDYELWTLAHDGVRVAFDGNPMIDTWNRHWPDAPTLASATISVNAGKHTLRVEHYPAGYAFALNVWLQRVETKPP